MSKAKRFSCISCGTSFEVYPPDTEHPRVSLKQPKEADVQGTVVKMTYKCKSCFKPTTLYWFRERRHIAVA